MTEKQLAEWEKTRNIGDEILNGVDDIKAGRLGRRSTVSSYPLVRGREKAGLSQSQFAAKDANQDSGAGSERAEDERRPTSVVRRK